ncbi:site-specific DNA-methyltransferase [Bacteroides pyogenes]|uniref:site-specific DNA-methyltransferase n=1 Tax=Bacteroides pyogenes TaxID=310300 RepID=UPI003B42E16B
MTDILKHLDLNSADGTQLNLDALYQIAPSAFTEVRDDKTGAISRKVNFEVFRQLLGDHATDGQGEMYQFTWVGKNAARAEAAKPTDKTLRPVVEDSMDWDNTKNIYIEGDNLEVLKLLQRSYMGKVKMIYIDPPYNTGNDFVYHDDFARTTVEEDIEAGNVDELGYRFRKNTDTNGKFHSDWCSMIYSRLLAARSLLTEDGVIFISIDDNEVRNLRNICDEVFGEHNNITSIIVRSNSRGQTYNEIAKTHEYVLVYAKSQDAVLYELEKDMDNSDLNLKDSISAFNIRELRNRNPKFGKHNRPGLYYPIYLNPSKKDKDSFMPVSLSRNEDYCVEVYPYNSQGIESCWRWGKIKFEQNINNETLISNVVAKEKREGGYNIYEKYRKTTYKPKSIWDDNAVLTETGTTSLHEIGFNGEFDFPKPVELVKRCIAISVKEDDIVLDFFSGSATTAHAVMQLNAEDGNNRSYICVQLPEETPEDSEARKAGYITIPEIAKERIRRAGKKIKEESPLTTKNLDTGFRVFRLEESNYEEVSISPNDYQQDQLNLFADNIKQDRTDLDLLFGAMLAWGVTLDLPMTQKEVDGCTIYTVNNGDLVACFTERITDNVVAAMADKTPLRVLFRDSCFAQDDQKINIYEQFKQLMDWTDDEAFKNIKVI